MDGVQALQRQDRRYDLIVFDWDGTLMDSAAAIAQAIMAASRDLDVPVPDEARARHVIGLGLSEALRHAVPDLPEAYYPRMVERYRFHYLAGDHALSLFPGIAEMLHSLVDDGWMVAVATGKSRVGLNRALGHSGLASLFHATRCADESFSKPHPAMLLELMDELGVEAGRTLMVGDTTHDLLMARNADVAALGVSFGAHPRDALKTASPLAILDDPAHYRAWFEENA